MRLVAITAALLMAISAGMMVLPTREGMETALMLGAISAQSDPMNMWIGGFMGLMSVAAIGWLWVTQSDRINLKLFMQVTGIFLILFAVDLFVYGVHELSEMSAIPLIGERANEFMHINTEALAHGGVFSLLITYSLLVVPVAWLVFSALLHRKSASA